MKTNTIFLALLVTLPGAFAAIAHVQTPAAGVAATGVSSVSLAFGSNVVAGNMIIASCMIGDLTSTPTITDTLSNTYPAADIIAIDSLDAGKLFLHHAYNIAGGADTVTCNITPSTATIRFTITEISGASTTAAFDQSKNASGTGTTIGTGNITPTVDGSLIYTTARLSSTVAGCTAGTDFTSRSNVPASPNTRLCSETYIQPTALTHNGTFTLSGSVNWAGIIASYKPASGAVTTYDANFWGAGL